MADKLDIPRGYFDLRTAAEFTGHSYKSVRNWSDELQPTEVRKLGTKVYLQGPALVELLIRKGGGKQTAGKEDDPLLAGSDSPGLERYRLAKAEIAEIDLAKRKGEIIEAAEMGPVMLAMCATLRRSHDAAVVKGGEAVRTVLDAGLDEFVAAIHRVTGANKPGVSEAGDGDDEGDAAQSVSDDAAVRRAGNHPADGADAGDAVSGQQPA